MKPRRSPQMYVRAILLCLITSTCFLNYWAYSHLIQGEPAVFQDIVNGTASAPQQFRVLVVDAAWLLHSKAHLPLRLAFATFDFFAALGSSFLMLNLMEGAEFFLQSSQAEKWLSYAIFLFLEGYYLLWLDWYQRPETLPTALFIALMLAVISRPIKHKSGLAFVALATAGLAVAQAFTRADVAFCFYTGMFLTACRSRMRLASSRVFALLLAAGAASIAVVVQVLLAKVVYPQATYGSTAVVQFWMNLEPLSLLPFALFMLPTGWTAWYVWSNRFAPGASWMVLLNGSALFALIWCVVGRIQEVRIFLPFALTLIPLTVGCALSALRRTGQADSARA